MDASMNYRRGSMISNDDDDDDDDDSGFDSSGHTNSAT